MENIKIKDLSEINIYNSFFHYTNEQNLVSIDIVLELVNLTHYDLKVLAPFFYEFLKYYHYI